MLAAISLLALFVPGWYIGACLFLIMHMFGLTAGIGFGKKSDFTDKKLPYPGSNKYAIHDLYHRTKPIKYSLALGRADIKTN